MLNNRLKARPTPRAERKTFVLGHNGGRPLLFTPRRYDSSTGLLHGWNESQQPMVLPLDRLLAVYKPKGLEWDDDESVQQLESEPAPTTTGCIS